MAGTQAVAAGDGQELSPRALALVRSAYRVITRQGSHRLSLQDVADEGGVSKGMVLYYFKSKENLFLTTMRYALERTDARIRERLAAVDADDPHEVVAALIDAIFIGPEQNRSFYLLYIDLVEHAARVPSFGQLSTLASEIIDRQFEEVIRAGVARGGFAVRDPAAATAAMRALIEGTFLTWMQRDDWRESHARFKELCRASLLRLLGAEEPVAR
ncbi:MAG TPA: TetR/AcrR family transcriptional regulator [Actinomycetota bacterium]|nr:TetR/AcrR family transcriptional regulator [Actinomycetota bacterium]